MSEQPIARQRVYCSELASLADAPLHGSAVQVHAWLLIEYTRPWKPKALVDNELPEQLNVHLANLPEAYMAQNGEKLRVQFIKQASSADQVHPRVMIAHHESGLYMREYDQLSDLMTLTADLIAAPERANFVHQDDDITLVCTNGQRDVCCARFGLPVYESLRSEIGRRAWQTTHVGGHRYAPNVLHLPSGLLFGFVSPDEVSLLQRKLDQGVLTLHRLRGRSALTPAAQAAEYYARVACHERAADGLVLEGASDTGVGTTADFRDAQGARICVTVQHTKSDAVLASCEGEPKPVDQFQLKNITIE